MKINRIDNKYNKTSFKAIIMRDNAEKKCGLKLYRLFQKYNTDKYVTFIKPLKTKTRVPRDSFIIRLAAAFFGFISGGFAATTLLYLLKSISIDTAQFTIIPFLFGGTLAGLEGLGTKKINDFSVQVSTHWTTDKDGNKVPAGIIAEEHFVKNDGDRYNHSFPLEHEIDRLKRKKFDEFIKSYDMDDLFEPKNYLRVLKEQPYELKCAEFFNYKIGITGNTLLTAFFDVVPNGEEYSEILEILKEYTDLDFNQNDGAGISCIEKVLRTENKEALSLIINAKSKTKEPTLILYSPELDSAYTGIKDKEFKKMVDDNIKWDFSNWLGIIKSYDVEKADKLKQKFNSPLLLDRIQLRKDINKILDNCKNMNFITYMRQEFLPELMEARAAFEKDAKGKDTKEN